MSRAQLNSTDLPVTLQGLSAIRTSSNDNLVGSRTVCHGDAIIYCYSSQNNVHYALTLEYSGIEAIWFKIGPLVYHRIVI